MIKVAIVEDNRQLRSSLTRMVDTAPGFRCICACSTAEDALREIPPLKPDVVLMDIHLPGRSGIECTRRLRDLSPSTQVLILTVYDDKDNIFNALKAGACGYLLKRSPQEKIIQAIMEVKDGGVPMSAQIARKVVTALREPSGRLPAGEGTFNQPSGGRLASEESLTERESEVLDYISKGYLEKEIADKMHVSVNTIKTHRKHIYQKLHLSSRGQVALRFSS